MQRSTLLKASLCIFVLTLETPTPGQSLPPFTFKTSRYHLSLAQLPLLKKEKKKKLSTSLSLLLLLLCPKGSSEEPSYKFNFQATLKHLFQKCVLFVSGTRRLFRALAWPSGPPPECFAPSDAVLGHDSPVLAPKDTVGAGRLESPGQPMGGAPRSGSLEGARFTLLYVLHRARDPARNSQETNLEQ